jgi:hypothetical protein
VCLRACHAAGVCAVQVAPHATHGLRPKNRPSLGTLLGALPRCLQSRATSCFCCTDQASARCVVVDDLSPPVRAAFVLRILDTIL